MSRFFIYKLIFVFSSFFSMYNMCQKSLHLKDVIRHPILKSPAILYSQKIKNHTELFLWDSRKQISTKLLSSAFSSVAVSFMPHGNGFCFVENEVLFLKFLEKRRPKRLDIYEPIYNFGVPVWIDDSSFCLHAQRGDRFGIFHVTTDSDVSTIAAFDNIDCTFPQKVGSFLFYIESFCDDFISTIICAPYPFIAQKKQSISIEDLFKSDSELSPTLIKKEEKQMVVSHDGPILFLKMIDEKEGFFIEPVSKQDITSESAFTCYHIKKIQNEWIKEKLFSFFLPSVLIDFSYNSIHSFLPRYYRGKLYFTDCYKRACRQGVDLFSYDIVAKKIIQLTLGKNLESFFSPVFIGNTLFYSNSDYICSQKIDRC
ncbi:hypothetical protein KAH94_02835 [bacterium]|nr:hypothetical protein [bacterium]